MYKKISFLNSPNLKKLLDYGGFEEFNGFWYLKSDIKHTKKYTVKQAHNKILTSKRIPIK